MISIPQFTAFSTEVLTHIPAIQKFALVAHENHATKKLRDRQGVNMLAILPGANRQGSAGGGVDQNVTWFFILEKEKTGQSDLDELVQFERLRLIIVELRKFIEAKHDDGNPLFSRYSPSQTNIEPEYSEFGGWNGYSMSIVF